MTIGRPPLPVGTYGEISVRENPPGHFRASARYRDIDGVRRDVLRVGKSRSAAVRKLRTALAERIEMGQLAGAVTGATTISQLATTWLAEVDDISKLARSTRSRYHDVVERHIVPGIGALRVRELGVPAVDRLLRSVRTEHGAANAKTTRSVLSGMIGLAMRHGAMTTNPVRDAASIPVEKKAPRALTPAEADDLMAKLTADPDAVQSDLVDLCEFMLGTGMRIGEACAVQIDQLDLEAGTVEVNRTTTRFGIEERTKTKAGWRIIAIPDHLVAMLRRRIADPDLATHVVLFPSMKGSVRDSSNTTGDLRRAFDRVGYEWVTSHTFRKTVATRLDEAGLSARAIADHLGHANPSLTLDVYMGRNVATSQAADVLNRPVD